MWLAMASCKDCVDVAQVDCILSLFGVKETGLVSSLGCLGDCVQPP